MRHIAADPASETYSWLWASTSSMRVSSKKLSQYCSSYQSRIEVFSESKERSGGDGGYKKKKEGFMAWRRYVEFVLR